MTYRLLTRQSSSTHYLRGVVGRFPHGKSYKELIIKSPIRVRCPRGRIPAHHCGSISVVFPYEGQTLAGQYILTRLPSKFLHEARSSLQTNGHLHYRY